MIVKDFEIYGAAFLNGKLLTFEGYVRAELARKIAFSKEGMFTWVHKSEKITTCKTDREALKKNEANFYVKHKGKELAQQTPEQVRKKLLKIMKSV
jgi:hypothetical protein